VTEHAPNGYQPTYFRRESQISLLDIHAKAKVDPITSPKFIV